jgi:hypothetical protein
MEEDCGSCGELETIEDRKAAPSRKVVMAILGDKRPFGTCYQLFWNPGYGEKRFGVVDTDMLRRTAPLQRSGLAWNGRFILFISVCD